MSLNMHDGADRPALQLLRDSEVALVDGLGAYAVLTAMLKKPESIDTMRYILAFIVIGAVFAHSITIASGLPE